jgi:UDP-N-acetylmuramoylalanine--D-glutamate ligase
MEEAVDVAFSMARRGESVLLSPACTSWDMFRNYGERGDRFQTAVLSLIRRSSSDDGNPGDSGIGRR